MRELARPTAGLNANTESASLTLILKRIRMTEIKFSSIKMLSISILGDDHLAHLDAVDDLWAQYGALLRAKEGVTGGMQWKTVAGRDYLTRYRQDPGTGKKVARSLGVRSAETERIYEEFVTEREAILSALRTLEPQVDTAGRIAKALRLGRVSSHTAALLRRLWVAKAMDGDHGLAVASAEALCAFERRANVLLPPRLIQNDGPIRFVCPIDRFSAVMDFVAQLPWEAGRTQAEIETVDDERVVVSSNGRVLAEVFSGPSLATRFDEIGLERDGHQSTVCAVSCRIPETIVIGRDASIVPVRALSPAAFVVFQALVGSWGSTPMHLLEERTAAAVEAARRISGEAIPSSILKAVESIRNYLSEVRPRKPA